MTKLAVYCHWVPLGRSHALRAKRSHAGGKLVRFATLKGVIRVQGSGFGVWGLGFGVWGLGFGAWGLGLGAWGI